MLNAPQPDGHGYAVFGKVVSGTEVVDKIKAVATGNKGPFQNVPSEPIVIFSATTNWIEEEFPENQYQAFVKQGKTEVKGQAFLKTRGGEVRYAAGSDVFLEPATDYAKKYYKNQIQFTLPLTISNNKAASYTRRTKADADGRFDFSAVPSGEYFIVTNVTWEVARKPQGGTLVKLIKVNNEPSLKIVISE